MILKTGVLFSFEIQIWPFDKQKFAVTALKSKKLF